MSSGSPRRYAEGKGGCDLARHREAIIRLSLVCSSFVASVLVAEAALRVVGYEYSPPRYRTQGDPAEWRFKHAFHDRSFRYDRDFIWRPRRGMAPFNSEGFRGAPLASARTPGEIRVVAIGDANTLGWIRYTREVIPIGHRRLRITLPASAGRSK